MEIRIGKLEEGPDKGYIFIKMHIDENGCKEVAYINEEEDFVIHKKIKEPKEKELRNKI